ncbi:MAG: excinuclease ABC subunit UvrB [Candidatus Methylacidiphilales bacterium]
MQFQLESEHPPAGDQPQAIAGLLNALKAGAREQVLLGVTGSGKTYTCANVIAALNRPTLVISHNKTLAAQLFSEFKLFFPHNAVEYFVSYFDYYQPEAYIPRTDTYIEKDSSINEEIERLRLSATSSLLTRRDVIVVASVSCIYGLGSPEDYEEMVVHLEVGRRMSRGELLEKLVAVHYERNDMELSRGKFRVRGDVVELCPAYREDGLRIEFFGDEIERLARMDPLTGAVLETLPSEILFPARHYVTPHEKMRGALSRIQNELDTRIAEFEAQGKYLEAQRLKMRTTYDLEMMQEMGFCNGIENYSRHISGRPPGAKPSTLIDFFPDDFLCIIDESHATVPQIGGMYAGDRSRKTVLVEHGFRLPSALDNRPLNFEEFEALLPQVIYVSATPARYEMEKVNGRAVEQVIRPTGLLDPEIIVRPLKGQIDEVMNESRLRVERGERVLVTTLTKRTAEDLTDYLRQSGFKVQYIHSEVDAIERVEILRSLRSGEIDVLVGINLLREGLDLPEVSLVAILDADKEGYLRSETSLIQTAGRAARHINGQVILFADQMTGSIRKLIEVSHERRERQTRHNREHGITPKSVVRGVQESLQKPGIGSKSASVDSRVAGGLQDMDVMDTIRELEGQMLHAAEQLDFEKAALLRDQVQELKKLSGSSEGAEPVHYGKTSRTKTKRTSPKKY